MDIRTLFLAQTCALIATALMLWIARSEADRRNGLWRWMLAGGSQGLAYLLLAGAGQLPALLSAGLGNALGALSVALFHSAIRQFLGQAVSRGWLALLVLMVSSVALLAGADYAHATIFNGFVYGLVQLLNARLLWQQPAPALRRVQRVVALFYLLMGLLLPLRAAALLLNGSGHDYLDMPPDWQAPLFLFGFLFIIVTNLGFLQMCKMRAEAEVRQQAMTDELTGLANRRALDAAVALALTAARRSRRPFAVLMVDLDHFKSINDGFGHHAGDAALAAFAARLSSCLGAQEQAFRWGGEEFCVLLPASDAAMALQRAEQLQRQAALPARDDMPALSASLGLTLWQAGDSAAAMFGRADGALYRAKSLGRDRVEVA